MVNGPVIKWSVILQWSVIKPTKRWISGCHTTIVASWKSGGVWTRDYQHWPLSCARSYSDMLLIIIILPFRVACDIRAFAYRLESLPYKKNVQQEWNLVKLNPIQQTPQYNIHGIVVVKCMEHKLKMYPSRLLDWVLDFLKVLYFFPGCLCHFKDFPYLFGAKFTGRKFYRWRHDNWPIGQWVIFHAAPDRACQSYDDSNPFRRNKSTSRLHCSLGRCATSHAMKLASLTFKNLSKVDL